MARAKKNVQSSKGEESSVNDVIKVKSPFTLQQFKAKEVKTSFKPRDNNFSIGKMVTAALQALKNDRGVALVTIRKYLVDNYGGFGAKMGKERQAEMKQFLNQEFEKGNIVMTNCDGEMINFTMRFNMAA